MTDAQINAAIAKACGWKTECTVCDDINCPIDPLPDYCSDLNAMHETEKVLTEHQRESIYPRIMGGWRNPAKPIYATARQRAEAFLRTLGKWEEVQR